MFWFTYLIYLLLSICKCEYPKSTNMVLQTVSCIWAEILLDIIKCNNIWLECARCENPFSIPSTFYLFKPLFYLFKLLLETQSYRIFIINSHVLLPSAYLLSIFPTALANSNLTRKNKQEKWMIIDSELENSLEEFLIHFPIWSMFSLAR